jgi:hypothetical protein
VFPVRKGDGATGKRHRNKRHGRAVFRLNSIFARGSMKTVNFVSRAFASCLVLGAASAAEAAESPFNPDNLNPEQLIHVTEVCRTVLGLSADERQQGGDRTGDDRLDFRTSHYQGCILSLSDSVRAVGEARTLGQVVTSGNSTGAALPAAGGRFAFASPREVARREKLACGSLSADLSGDEIDNCARALSQTFYVIDHAIE